MGGGPYRNESSGKERKERESPLPFPFPFPLFSNQKKKIRSANTAHNGVSPRDKESRKLLSFPAGRRICGRQF